MKLLCLSFQPGIHVRLRLMLG